MDAKVTLVIVAIWLALTVPAIQAAREQTRASSCSANLKTLALGLQIYHDTYKVFPGGASPLPGCSEDHGANNPLQSAHPGGAYVAMADGAVWALSENVDLAVLLRLAIRDDGQAPRPLPTASLESVSVGQSPDGPTAAQLRTWTDATGQFKVEAELVEVKDGKARLKKADGRVLDIPLAKLSAADRKHVKSLDEGRMVPEGSRPSESQAAEQTRYLNQIALAVRAWRNEDFERANELLNLCPPELRHWEWGYLKRKCGVKRPLTLRGHASMVDSVAYSPDGLRLASASWDKTVKVWNARTGAEALTLRGHSERVQCVAFSPDGKRIASGGEDQTIKVWDAQTGAELLTLRGHNLPVSSVAFSPDGQRLASTGWDTAVKIWDAQTGADKLALRGDPKIAAELANQRELTLSLRGNTLSCSSLAFSPDSKRIASASGIPTVAVWDARTDAESSIP